MLWSTWEWERRTVGERRARVVDDTVEPQSRDIKRGLVGRVEGGDEGKEGEGERDRTGRGGLARR